MEEEYDERGFTLGPGPGSEASLPDPVYDDEWKSENFWLDFFRKEGVKAGQSLIDTFKYGGAIKVPGIKPIPKLLPPSSHKTINITPTPKKPVGITSQKGSEIINKVLNTSRFKTVPSDIVKGPFPSWQSQNVPFGQTSPNITKKVHDVAQRTALQGMSKDKPLPSKKEIQFSKKALRQRILDNKLTNPSIEQLTMALKTKTDKADFYTRTTTRKDWEVLGNHMQRKWGGTDVQKNKFVNHNIQYKAQLQKEIKSLNDYFKLDYLQLVNTVIDEEFIEGVNSLTDLYGNEIKIKEVDDLVYGIATILSQDPRAGDVYDLGHINAAKNIYDESKEKTTADFSSNLDIQPKRSIRDWRIGQDPKMYELPTRTPGKVHRRWKGGEIKEPGNIRKSNLDAPKIINLLLGTSPNLDIEYNKFLGEFGNALDEPIPTFKDKHFMSYLRKRVSKWQKGIIGKQQLDQFPDKLNKFIDDYMNELYSGEYLDDPAGSDAIDAMILEKRSGKAAADEAAQYRRRASKALFPQGSRDLQEKFLNDLFKDRPE